MPPIEKAPRSFYANPSSDEAVKLYARAEEGEFKRVIDVLVEDPKTLIQEQYWLFEHRGDNAVTAFEIFGPDTHLLDEQVILGPKSTSID